MRLVRFFCVSLALLCLPMTARADVNTIRDSDSEIDVGVGANQLRYGETVNGSTFDTEKGWQPDFNFGGGTLIASSNPWLNNIYLRGDANIVWGTTYYNGGLQELSSNGVTTVPYKTTTHDQIYNFAGKIGRSFALGNYTMATPYVDVGYHYWNRNISGFGGYAETYGNGFAMGGVMLQVSPFQKWVFSLSGEGGSTFSPEMSSLGVTYNLGSGTIYEAAAKISYEFMPHLSIFGTGVFTGYNYGASPVIFGANEPDSTTHNFKTFLGLAYQFNETGPAPTYSSASTRDVAHANTNSTYKTTSYNSNYVAAPPLAAAPNYVQPATTNYASAAPTTSYTSAQPTYETISVSPNARANGF